MGPGCNEPEHVTAAGSLSRSAIDAAGRTANGHSPLRRHGDEVQQMEGS